MPLQLCKAGSVVRLRHIAAEQDLVKYLYGMGLYPGVELEVMTADPTFIVSVKGVQIALGRDVVSRLHVG